MKNAFAMVVASFLTEFASILNVQETNMEVRFVFIYSKAPTAVLPMPNDRESWRQQQQ